LRRVHAASTCHGWHLGADRTLRPTRRPSPAPNVVHPHSPTRARLVLVVTRFLR
jgi:hypothetical protein